MASSSRSRSSSSKKRSSSSPRAPFYAELRTQAFALVLVAVALYAQTLRFEFALDDKMVIADHKTVQQGFAGIPRLLTQDSFAGFDENYERASQRKTYRPISFISFAVEKQLFNNAPAVAHAVNVALYGLTALVLFLLLRALLSPPAATADSVAGENVGFARGGKFADGVRTWLPFAATLLFIVHPAHTAVVPNIKSRDEIFALLFGLTALLLLARYARGEQKTRDFALSIGAFAAALLSKESASLFVVPIVLAIPTFLTDSPKRALKLAAPYLLLTLSFAALWFGVFGRVEEGLYAYRLHNPFAEATSLERIATGFATLGLYILKAFFPWSLSEAYTYNALPILGWSDWRAFGGLALTAGIAGWAAWSFLRRRSVLAFCLLSLLATLALASNLLLYSGSMFGDRFLYAPSVFAVLAIVWATFEAFGARSKVMRLTPALALVLAFSAVYAARSLARIPDWRSDYALLQADHRSTPESIATARNYAAQLILRAGKSQNDVERSILLDEADDALARALATDSTADPAVYDLKALSALQRKNYERALVFERRAIELDSTNRAPEHRKPIFWRNLASIYVSRAAEHINQDRIAEGVRDLQEALRFDPKNDNAHINLGMAYGRQRDFRKALEAFQAAYKLNPASSVAQQYIFHIQQALQEEEEENAKASAGKYTR
jgi:tetratricopeptide (TPR) repeat protein